jgi:hypothetical protein
MQPQQKMTSNIILTPQLTAVTQPQSSVLNDEVFKIFVPTFYVHLEKHEACHREICIMKIHIFLNVMPQLDDQFPTFQTTVVSSSPGSRPQTQRHTMTTQKI